MMKQWLNINVLASAALFRPSRAFFSHRSRVIRSINYSSEANISIAPIVICGPSGVGKGTLIAALLIEFGDQVAFSVSHTTRLPRTGELNGREYHFVDKVTMQDSIERGDFIEHVCVHGNYYGTSLESIREVAHQQRVCLLDIDTQGVKLVQANSGKLDADTRFVFIAPPSLASLQKRLEGRGTETKSQIEGRLKTAEAELRWAESNKHLFDFYLMNHDLEESKHRLVSLIGAWRPHLRRISGASSSVAAAAIRAESTKGPPTR